MFCLTSQASAQKPECKRDHVGMEMSPWHLIPLCDFFLTVENQHPLEPCSSVFLLLITVF